MSLFRQPVLGAVLNLIWFGLADIYVGYIGAGLVKMTVPILALVAGDVITNADPIGMRIYWLIYSGFSAYFGYQAVRDRIAQDNAERNNASKV